MDAAKCQSPEALREALKDKLPGELVRILRETIYLSRKEFAATINRKTKKSITDKSRWSEDIVKFIETPDAKTGRSKTPLSQRRFEDIINAGLFGLVLYPEVWQEAFEDAFRLQSSMAFPVEALDRASQPAEPQPADLPKTPNGSKMEAGGGEAQEAKMPYETPSGKKPTSVQREEVDLGAKPVKPRYTRRLALLVLLLAVVVVGSCAGGIVLSMLLQERGFIFGKQAGPIATIPPSTTAPQVEYRVVTATGAPTQQVVERVVRETVVTEKVVERMVIVTATPPPYTPTPRNSPTPTPTPTDTPVPTDTPLPTETPPSLASFQDSFDTGLDPRWEVISGEWRMVNNAIRADAGDAPLLLVGNSEWDDYTVSVDTRGNCHLGVVVRADTKQYMSFEIWPDWQNVWYALFVVSDGSSVPVVRAIENNSYRTPSRLSLSVRGDIYTGYWDSVRIFQVQDTTMKNGKAGLRLAAGCLADNFMVTPLD